MLKTAGFLQRLLRYTNRPVRALQLTHRQKGREQCVNERRQRQPCTTFVSIL